MIDQPVTLAGDAEWPKVADAVIEAIIFIEEMNSGLYSQLKLSQRYLARPCAAGLQAAPAGGGGWGARGRRGGVKRPFEFPIRPHREKTPPDGPVASGIAFFPRPVPRPARGRCPRRRPGGLHSTR
jgi:hypothetical protein